MSERPTDIEALRRRSQVLEAQISIQKARNVLARLNAAERNRRAPRLIYKTFDPVEAEQRRARHERIARRHHASKARAYRLLGWTD